MAQYSDQEAAQTAVQSDQGTTHAATGELAEQAATIMNVSADHETTCRSWSMWIKVKSIMVKWILIEVILIEWIMTTLIMTMSIMAQVDHDPVSIMNPC